MRNFNQKFRLRDSDRHIRLLYTLFLLLMFVGFCFSFFWAHSMTGLSPEGIAALIERQKQGENVGGAVERELRPLAETYLQAVQKVSERAARQLADETEEHAQARGARIYAEVLGGRLTSDGGLLLLAQADAGRAEALVEAVKTVAGDGSLFHLVDLENGELVQGEVDVFVAMGGNFLSATPDTDYTAAALRRCPALDGLQRTFYISGFAKVLAPNWRVGFVAAPAPLVEPLIHTKMLSTLTTPAMMERAMALCVDQGHLRRHADRIRTRLDAARTRSVRLAQASSALNATGLGSQAGVVSLPDTLAFMKACSVKAA